MAYMCRKRVCKLRSWQRLEQDAVGYACCVHRHARPMWLLFTLTNHCDDVADMIVCVCAGTYRVVKSNPDGTFGDDSTGIGIHVTVNSCTPTHTHPHTHTLTHTHTHTQTHTHTDIDTHTHTHTHIHFFLRTRLRAGERRDG
jgi:hypothetical protein